MTSREDPTTLDAHHGSSGPIAGGTWLRKVALITALGCSCAALGITFLGLSQFDLSIIRYVRSVTIHLPWNQLTIPWMAFTSDAGNWIGEGTQLVAVSLVLLAVGWGFSKATVKAAGIQTLIAHGLAALLVNGLKHLIGRPRPKFAHSGEWQLAPSWTSGLDSFPSGHTAASFAVAAVLAKRFPALAPLCLGVAAFVAISRIFRGSHFPTDVLGGAVIGAISGAIAAAPLSQWRTSLQDGIRQAAMGASMALALLWTLSRPAEEGMLSALFIGLGLAGIASGLWLRRMEWIGNGSSGVSRQSPVSSLLIVYGLASLTTSLSVVAAVGFACLAVGLNAALAPEQEERNARGWLVMREGVLLGGLLLALLILYDARGVLPFR
ncbi:MAG: phosphatase PAP2 family protein [Nitrospira sp.]|nr:phosphatase PAP2 family protein [Nitrospira sp.]MDH5624736.1 phosphatase PAP2 family protein [Nitrospira sp.]